MVCLIRITIDFFLIIILTKAVVMVHWLGYTIFKFFYLKEMYVNILDKLNDNNL